MSFNKPSLFIGSAAEAIEHVDAINSHLNHDAVITTWKSAFEVQDYPMDSLEKQLEIHDFAVFVFSPDDIVNMRENEYIKTRDNSLFELGMFWGKLGRERAFFILPKDVEGYKLPTDLEGLNTITYEHNRSDNNIKASLDLACGEIARKIRTLGRKTDASLIAKQFEEESDKFYSLVMFYNTLTQKLWEDAENKYEHLYQAFISHFSPPDSYKVTGGSIWKAVQDEGLHQVAGNKGQGLFYYFGVNEHKEGNIYVVDTFLDSEINFVLYRKGIVQTYLICYPISNNHVFTVHIDGKNSLDGKYDEVLETNNDLVSVIGNLLGGAKE